MWQSLQILQLFPLQTNVEEETRKQAVFRSINVKKHAEKGAVQPSGWVQTGPDITTGMFCSIIKRQGQKEQFWSNLTFFETQSTSPEFLHSAP